MSVFSYGRPISELSAIICILTATEQVVAALEISGPDCQFAQAMFYSDKGVVMNLIPGALIGWSDWGAVLRVLTRFMYQYEFMEFAFTIHVNGVIVGVGAFANHDEASEVNDS